MALQVKVEHPGYPKGTELAVQGLGTLKNGETTTLTAEHERGYIVENRQTVKDGLHGQGIFTVSGSPEVKGGVEGVLGVKLDEISSVAPNDPTAMNLTPDGKRFEDANLGGAVTEPTVINDTGDEVPVSETSTPVVESVKEGS